MHLDRLQSEAGKNNSGVGLLAVVGSARKVELGTSHTRADLIHSVSVDYDAQPVSYESLRKPFVALQQEMPELLHQRNRWKDVVVDGMPIMNRLYFDWKDNLRIFLHRLDPPPDKGPPILHYHQWPSIVHVHKGGYQQQLAFGPPDRQTPPICATMDVLPGTTYEMVHPHLWHSVILSESSWSTMLVKMSRDNSWRNPMQITPLTQSFKFPPLPLRDREEMFEQFEKWYPKQ